MERTMNIAVRKSVGSNPTGVTLLFLIFSDKGNYPYTVDVTYIHPSRSLTSIPTGVTLLLVSFVRRGLRPRPFGLGR